MKIRKGDMVKILSGKDRGKRAKVIRVFPRQQCVLVEGLNVKKRHRRARRQDKKGEIILLPSPVSVSVVQLVCPSCGKPTRIGSSQNPAGERVRICKRCGKAVSG